VLAFDAGRRPSFLLPALGVLLARVYPRTRAMSMLLCHRGSSKTGWHLEREVLPLVLGRRARPHSSVCRPFEHTNTPPLHPHARPQRVTPTLQPHSLAAPATPRFCSYHVHTSPRQSPRRAHHVPVSHTHVHASRFPFAPNAVVLMREKTAPSTHQPLDFNLSRGAHPTPALYVHTPAAWFLSAAVYPAAASRCPHTHFYPLVLMKPGAG
jgi:hypothetical protein